MKNKHTCLAIKKIQLCFISILNSFYSEEGKGLIVEAYRWVGDIMKQQLNGVKPVQMTELEAAFEKCEKAKKGERLLRSQQTFGGGGADEDGEEGEEKSDDKDDDGKKLF